MTILVTGGAGYIGSHFLLQLDEARDDGSITYDNFSTGFNALIPERTAITGDIRDKKALVKAMTEHNVTAVVHFAASCYVGQSVTDPAIYYDNNVHGSLVLLEAMREAGVNTLVFSSSCATYGVPARNEPICEDFPQMPINPYGFSKLIVERMLADFATAYGLKYVALRYFNAAGADPRGRTGEMHDPETHLIPLVLRAAKDPQHPVQIYGRDYPTPDGTCIRDYVHVLDIASAHVLALDYLERGGANDCFNIGSESGHSVLQILEASRRVTAHDIPAQDCARRPGDPPLLVANAEKIKQKLGWKLRHSSIDEILSSAWNWMLSRS